MNGEEIQVVTDFNSMTNSHLSLAGSSYKKKNKFPSDILLRHGCLRRLSVKIFTTYFKKKFFLQNSTTL